MKLSNLAFGLVITLSLIFSSCDYKAPQQTSDSGVQKATVKVQTDANGHSGEQRNIVKRTVNDNTVGQVQHLYVISAYSGDVLEYSTVDGKVTSGGKRLSPKSVVGYTQSTNVNDNYVTINGNQYLTNEVPDEGGSYGESGNYLYWFDTQGNYHQYYPSGGTYLHISSKPLRIRKANMTFTVDTVSRYNQ